MPLDPSIPLGIQQQPFNNPFQALVQLRQQQQQRKAQEQQQELQRQQLAQGQQRLDLERGEIEEARKVKLSAEQVKQTANEAYALLSSGKPEDKDKILSAMPPEPRLMAEGWLKSMDDAKAARSQQQIAQAKQAAQIARAMGDDEVTTRVMIRMLGGTPEQEDQVSDPAKRKEMIDRFLTIGDVPKPDVTLNPGDIRVSPTGQTIASNAPKPPERSPAYKEWQDYKAEGGPLDFSAYQTMDANRRRPVSITNAETDDKMIDEAARNILANPRDLTSVKNISSLRGDQRMKLFNKIKEKNPDFNVGNIDRQIKFLDSYESPTGRAAVNRGAMNNILQHAADLSAVNENYRRTNMRIINTPIAVLSRQAGMSWQQFQTPLSVLKDEIALYFAGGYAPTSDQAKTWDRIANDTATPAQIEQFAKDIIHVGLRRADTHNEQFKTMMGYDDPNLITPQAVQAGERLGLGPEVKKYGSGGQFGAKPAAAGDTMTIQSLADPTKKARGPRGPVPAGWKEVAN